MEDDLNFISNGRQPQFFFKWKTTSIFFWLKTTSISFQMEDDLNFFFKWKTTSIFGTAQPQLVLPNLLCRISEMVSFKKYEKCINKIQDSVSDTSNGYWSKCHIQCQLKMVLKVVINAILYQIMTSFWQALANTL